MSDKEFATGGVLPKSFRLHTHNDCCPTTLNSDDRVTGWSESQKEAIRETVLAPTSRLTKELVEHYQKQGYGLWESVAMANGEQLHSILCELEKVVGLDEK